MSEHMRASMEPGSDIHTRHGHSSLVFQRVPPGSHNLMWVDDSLERGNQLPIGRGLHQQRHRLNADPVRRDPDSSPLGEELLEAALGLLGLYRVMLRKD